MINKKQPFAGNYYKKNNKNRYFCKDLNFGSKFKKYRISWCEVLMKKSTILIIIGVAIAIVFGITALGMLSDELINKNIPRDTPSNVEIPGLGHPDALTSGPLTITKYEYKSTENIFMIMSGLEKNDKGNIRILMPDGRLYKTIQYDGSQKES